MAAPNPDRKALSALGTAVRARLASDPAVYKVPIETAEIFAVGNFITADECRHLIALIDEVARPSELFDEAHLGIYRTSYSGDIPQTDSVVRSIERRLSDLIGIDLSWGETVQGQRYMPGQEFREHCDWFDTQAPYWPSEVPRGGQRSWTAMAYLNTVDAGGETEFCRIGASIPPQQGSLLLWNNASADGQPNFDTMHAALPVKAGVKYVITKWFRTRTWG